MINISIRKDIAPSIVSKASVEPLIGGFRSKSSIRPGVSRTIVTKINQAIVF
uniref:Uncharacterized protein n=1 Tax=Arundo donax TaxID=35708 RepID=A0A0A9B328_ARUDO